MQEEHATMISFEEHMLNLVTEILRPPLLHAELRKYLIVDYYSVSAKVDKTIAREFKLMQEEMLKSSSPKEKRTTKNRSWSEGSVTGYSRHSRSDLDIDESRPFYADVRRRLFQPYLRNYDHNTPSDDVFRTTRKQRVPSLQTREELLERTKEKYWTREVISRFYTEVYSRYESEQADRRIREWNRIAGGGQNVGISSYMPIDHLNPFGVHTAPVGVVFGEQTPLSMRAEDGSSQANPSSEFSHRFESLDATREGFGSGILMSHPCYGTTHFESQAQHAQLLHGSMAPQTHQNMTLTTIPPPTQQTHPLIPTLLGPWLNQPNHHTYSSSFGYHPVGNAVQPLPLTTHANVFGESSMAQETHHNVQSTGWKQGAQLPFYSSMVQPQIPDQEEVQPTYYGRMPLTMAGTMRDNSGDIGRTDPVQHGRTYGINFDLSESMGDITDSAPFTGADIGNRNVTYVSSLQENELDPCSIRQYGTYITTDPTMSHQHNYEASQEPSHASYSIGPHANNMGQATATYDDVAVGGTLQANSSCTAQHGHPEPRTRVPYRSTESRLVTAHDFRDLHESQTERDQPETQHSTQQDSSQEYDMYRAYAAETDGGRMLPFHRWQGLRGQVWRQDYNARVTERWEEERGRQRDPRC